MMDFDATFFPSAFWDENSLYPKKETGFAFRPHMNDVYVGAFKIQTFTKNGNERTILELKYYNPHDHLIQHFPVEEKVKTIEVNRMQNSYNIDTLTNVDIEEIVEIGGKVIEIYEGVINREKNLKNRRLEKI